MSIRTVSGSGLRAQTGAAAIELPAGANIASASTVNLDLATGNRVHITGTTTITAWALTRGPRTVIFDGACQLTYHATTNRLNSGATNYTTSAGDLAVIDSNGTTVFVNITKVAGTPVVAGDSTLAFAPQSKSADYTFVLGDAGDIFVHPAADTVGRTWTIPANASVAYAIGTTIMLIVQKLAGLVVLNITTDTLRTSNGVTGAKTLVANRQYMLVKIAATEWLLSAGESSVGAAHLAVAVDVTPFVTVYPWSSAGFGTKFADPVTLPAGAGYGVAFSPAGTELAMAINATPFISVYRWSSAGFGTMFSNPATLPAGPCKSVAFSPAGTEIAIGSASTPFLSAYPWTSSGFGTKFADPATAPAGTGRSVAFSPAGTELAVGCLTTSPFMAVYQWSSAGFGTKFADPGTLPAGAATGIAFSPAGTEIAITHGATTPYVTAYPWSSSGFGTKLANPATLPANAEDLAFNSKGPDIAVGVACYPWSSTGFGVRYADPAVASIAAGSVAFSPAGTEIAIGGWTTPFLNAYTWTSTGYGTKFANPATIPAGEVRYIDFIET